MNEFKCFAVNIYAYFNFDLFKIIIFKMLEIKYKSKANYFLKMAYKIYASCPSQ